MIKYILIFVIGLIIVLSVKLVLDLFIQQLTMIEDISKKLKKLNEMGKSSKTTTKLLKKD